MDKIINNFTDAIEANSVHFPSEAKADFDWFLKYPDCYYRIREAYPNEYGTERLSSSYQRFVLVQLCIVQDPIAYISSNGGKTGRSAHHIQLGRLTTIAPSVDNSFLRRLDTLQTRSSFQKALSELWARGIIQGEIVNINEVLNDVV